MTDPRIRRAVRAPLIVTALGGLGIAVAFVLDQTPAYEYALTIGAPSLIILILGLIWLLGMIAWYLVTSRSQRPRNRPK